MKEFFKKIGTNLKNNKITAVVVVFVALVCAGAGYAINYFVEAFGTSIPAPYNIVIAVVATLLLFNRHHRRRGRCRCQALSFRALLRVLHATRQFYDLARLFPLPPPLLE